MGAAMLADLTTAARFARDFGRFLERAPSLDECRRRLADQLARRDETFLGIVARGVLGNARSPYRLLLSHARIGLDDIAAWVKRGGVEGALAELYDAGVYVTLDEFKGRRPIRRGGLDLAVTDRDFDNRLLTAHYEGRSGATRGTGTRSLVDLDLLAHEAAGDLVLLTAVGGIGRPFAVWRPALPPGAGLKTVLRSAHIGLAVERWFSQTPAGWSAAPARHSLLLRYIAAAGRWHGRRFARPEHTPVGEALTVARWLADKVGAGRPPVLETNVASGVRVAIAAREHDLDIGGTLFRLGSEAFTEARARTIAEAGVVAFCQFHLAEVGRLGVPCCSPASVDEVHVALDKIALLQRERPVGAERVGALFCTTIHPSSPKLMLNVELGDHGVLGARACGCPFEALGLRQHLSRIRSYEKLTTEGMHFVGADLVRLLEEVLPARFGGDPTDYQLVEEDDGGLARVSLVVSPRVGPVDEAALVAAALAVLASPPTGKSGEAMMAAYWRDARTLRVVRREPHATAAAKIMPLHVIGAGGHREAGPAPR